MKTTTFFLTLGIIGVMGAGPLRAADQAPTVESRLRERLRDTMLQLRAAETDRAALQVAQTQAADEKKALTEKLATITKEANANRLVAQAVDGLKSQVARQDKEIAQIKEALETSRQTSELARKQEAERAKRADEVVADLQRLVADRQAKNVALYKIACEILQRYQKFGLGEALVAREPFVGITRVKLENLVQDYQDKLADERTTLTEKDLAAHADQPVGQSK
jgi:chromosome segregation ATPase